MAYLFKNPTENEFAGARVLLKAGAGLFLGALCVMLAIRFTHSLPLPILWQRAVNVGFGLVSFGFATILWGFRVHARAAEFRSVSRGGYTPAYEAACTMVALVLYLAPIVWFLVAFDIIHFTALTPPSAR